jgi:hypothetical protein
MYSRNSATWQWHSALFHNTEFWLVFYNWLAIGDLYHIMGTTNALCQQLVLTVSSLQ